eukprot:993511-Amorphochlora_amoeboformis.AAC.1
MPKPVFVQERDEESVSLLQDSPKLPAEETRVKVGVSERGSNNQGQNAVRKSMCHWGFDVCLSGSQKSRYFLKF